MKSSHKIINLLYCLAFLFLPIFSIVLTCYRLRFNIFSINPFGNIGNDEVSYYKMVESVINYGFPKGYYGYNESHALIGNFSTWGPMPLLLWSLFGLFIGWNYFSPIIINILLLSIALLVFYLLLPKAATPPEKSAYLLYSKLHSFRIIYLWCGVYFFCLSNNSPRS